MSSSQRPQRRTSTRLLDKDDAHTSSNRAQINGHTKTSNTNSESSRSQLSKPSNEKKRKIVDYDEDDDGFLFTRVKKNKLEPEQAERTERAPRPQKDALPLQQQETEAVPPKDDDLSPPTRKRRKKLSFSTPNHKEKAPVRRSKRLSREHEDRDTTPAPRAVTKIKDKSKDTISIEQQERTPVKGTARSSKPIRPDTKAQLPSQNQPQPPPQPETESGSQAEIVPTQQEDHSATKIALPFADTPVIKRNKAMREGKSGKGERRSSLGLRGRRASSLIETGNSNALPHSEVEIPDFHKHIESEGLPEPRRMRQLLTWCATRALDEKPIGTGFEDASARSAARVIEEELLKELANRSELSDWFSREDIPAEKEPLPERPNPKNMQNVQKISELEEQIKRLKMEKEGLEALLRPPSISHPKEINKTKEHLSNRELLSDSDIAALELLQTESTSLAHISQRLNGLYNSLGPTIDAFADGIHRIGQYRDAADNVASRTLSMCAQRLAEREKEGRRKALPEGDNTTPKDLGGVLRSLSRAER